MTEPNRAALDFLLTRRSRPAPSLVAPWPGKAEIETILTAAARSPDHGKLEPWRFIVLGRPALARLSALVTEIGTARGRDPADVAKLADTYARSGRAVVVVESPKASPKIPPIEQTYSTGAVCVALLNAALADGWGAVWLTGWAAYDREFLTRGLGLDEHERMAGIIHIGTETAIPPDRPRPDLSAITTWVDA